MAKCLVERETLLSRRRERQVSCINIPKIDRLEQRPGLQRSSHASTICERLHQEAQHFTPIATVMPEPGQGDTYAQSQLNLRLALLRACVRACPLQEKTKCCPYVLLLAFQLCNPPGLLCPAQLWFSLLGQRQVIASMSLKTGLHLPTCGKHLQSILSDRFKHHEAGFLPLLLRLLQQTLVNELGYCIQHPS